jgi:hypothetical protein
VQPQVRQPRRQLAGRQVRLRHGGRLEPGERGRAVGARVRQRAEHQRRGHERAVADRAGGLTRRVRSRRGLAELAGEQCGVRERELEPGALGGLTRGEPGERRAQPRARVRQVAEPPLLVGERDGEREPPRRRRVGERADQRRARAADIAGRGLRLGQPFAHPRATTLVALVGQPQRCHMEADRVAGGDGMQLVRRGFEQRDRVLVAGPRRVLDVVRPRDRPRPARGERRRGPRVRAEPPAAAGARVDRVPHDRMPEREPPRHPGLTHERDPQQLVERFECRRLVQLRDLAGQPDVERIADHRRALDQPPRRPRQRRQLGRQRRLDRRRHVVKH